MEGGYHVSEDSFWFILETDSPRNIRLRRWESAWKGHLAAISLMSSNEMDFIQNTQNFQISFERRNLTKHFGFNTTGIQLNLSFTTVRFAVIILTFEKVSNPWQINRLTHCAVDSRSASGIGFNKSIHCWYSKETIPDYTFDERKRKETKNRSHRTVKYYFRTYFIAV